MDDAKRPMMMLADQHATAEQQAEELQLGAALDGRLLLVMKRGEQCLWYPLGNEQLKRLLNALYGASQSGVVR